MIFARISEKFENQIQKLKKAQKPLIRQSLPALSKKRRRLFFFHICEEHGKILFKNFENSHFKNTFFELTIFFPALKTPGSNKTSPRQRKTQKHAGSDTE